MADEVRITIGGKPLNALVVSDAGSTQSASAIGATDDVAWNGTDSDASLIAIMKAIYAQNATMISSLETIATNTTPAA